MGGKIEVVVGCWVWGKVLAGNGKIEVVVG